MASHRTLAVLCAAAALLLAVAEVSFAAAAASAAASASSAPEDSFTNTSVTLDGETMEVADSVGDKEESDSIQQDSTAEWQTTMVQGLYAQRKAEKEFIERLVHGGASLNAMVNNITKAFQALETSRQERGSQLIKAHFDNEILLLNKSSEAILSKLDKVLAAQSSDSDTVKALKKEVTAIFSDGFKQQLLDESALFKKQMQQIQQEHSQQNVTVTVLFSLLTTWKDDFQKGLKNSQQSLENIAQSWDML